MSIATVGVVLQVKVNELVACALQLTPNKFQFVAEAVVGLTIILLLAVIPSTAND